MCDGVVYIAPKIYTVKDLTTVRDIQLDPKLAKATFLVSAPSLDYCPPECGPEVGFAVAQTRVNLALNTLTGQKNLAQYPKHPAVLNLSIF